MPRYKLQPPSVREDRQYHSQPRTAEKRRSFFLNLKRHPRSSRSRAEKQRLRMEAEAIKIAEEMLRKRKEAEAAAISAPAALDD